MYAKAIKRLLHFRIPAIPGGPVAWIVHRLRRPVGVAAAKPEQQERKLTTDSAMLEATLQNMDQGISLVDKDLNVLVFNTRLLELLEYPLDLFRPGDPFEAFIRHTAERGEYGPGDVDELVQARVELAKRFEPHRFERTRPDGTVIDIHGTPLPGGGFVTTYTDITERKRAEDELRRSQERYALAVQAMNEGVYDWRISSDEIHFSNRVKAVLGFSPEALSTRADWIERIHPEDKKIHHEKLVAHLKGETDRFEYKYRYRTASGEWRWICQHGVALRDNDGRAYRMAGSVGDITIEKRAEEALIASELALQARVTELEEAKRTLERQGAELVRLAENLTFARDRSEAANRAKSDFLAAMSHELRTSLNAIIGFSDVMRSETFGPVGNSRYLDYLGDINDSGQHLLDLITDILDLSKIESGEGELNEESIDVAEVVESVLKLVQARAVQGRVDVVSDLPDSLPPLRADQRKLKQILANLLTNAIKVSDAGGKVTLKAWCHRDSGYVFQVVDNGIGIALEDIPKALAPFQQVGDDLDRRYEGTGLGLPLTKSLVELHGGSLDLQSQLGVGTTVTARFPAERIVQVSDHTPGSAGRPKPAG